MSAFSYGRHVNTYSNRIEFVRPAGFYGQTILDVIKQVTYMRYRDSRTMLTM